MSWFTIIVGNIEQSQVEKVKQKHPSRTYEFRCENIYVLAGGIEETSFINPNNLAQTGGILCGIVFAKEDIDLKIVTNPLQIQKVVARRHNYQGSYAGATWNADAYTFFNDQLG